MRAVLRALSLIAIATGCSVEHVDEPKPIGRVEQRVVTSFAAGSLVIPMDTTYQNAGTLRAFGLVYRLLQNNVPVRWIVRTGKTQGSADFTASGTDVQTSAAITSHGYRGGPFVIDSADRARALPIITAWQATNTTTVHSMAAFSADVRQTLTAAPRIAVFQDGNELIGFRYLNAAGIPDSTGKAWPTAAAATYPTYPDVLTPAAIRGSATGGAFDGALLRADGTPAYCQLTSQHYNAPADAEVVREVRGWLASSPMPHAYMQCEAVETFENHANGRFLTTNGVVDDGAAPGTITNRQPDSTFAQYDGSLTIDTGSVDSIGLATGSALRAGDVVLINNASSPLTQRMVYLTGNLDGNTAFGKVSYLAGHDYATTTPITSNPLANGARLFLNSLFESNCASPTFEPKISLTKTAPATATGTTITFTLVWANTGSGIADNAIISDTLPTGTTFVSATGGGTFAAGVVTWNLGNLKPATSGSVSFTVNAPVGVYSNQARIDYRVSLTPKQVLSNTTSTTRNCGADADCPVATPACHSSGMFSGLCRECSATNATRCTGTKPVCVTSTATCGCNASTDCSGTTPICDAATRTCVACATNADCSGATPICNVATKTCRACTADTDCSGATPACHTTGAFAGTCRECSATNATACSGVKPVCLTSTATCGCNASSECPSTAPTCVATSKTCVSGCSTDADCTTTAAPKCDTSTTPGACVECLVDASCGTLTSARVCTTGKTCATGCRGPGFGNGCPAGQSCTSTTNAIGTCTDDADGDGLTDTVEKMIGTNPLDADSDDDGVPDGAEPDYDKDTDGDGLINALDPDSDDDGLFDGTELGRDCEGKDTDKTKLRCVADGDKGATKTDPLKKDTDGGGLGDGAEDLNRNGVRDPGEKDPLVPSDDMGSLDSDGDGLSDDFEKAIGTNPLDADSDDDGLPDGAEPNPAEDRDGDGLINALDPDSDNDGLFDGTELGRDCEGKDTDKSKGRCIADADKGATKTSPLKKDTDGGGMSDGSEDLNRNGVIDPGEKDPNNPGDDKDIVDTDKDGLSDEIEKLIGSNPNDADSDDDGVIDGDEANPTADLDGDGKIAVLDPDSDGDGLFDGTEVGLGCTLPSTDPAKKSCLADQDPTTKTSPAIADTDKGGVSDGDEDTNKNGKVDPGETDPLNPGDDKPGVDAGVDGGVDAGGDGAVVDDTGTHEDTGTTPPAADDGGTIAGGGCGCEVPAAPSRAAPALALLLGLTLVRRRRR